ncbi:MAG: hypothetical protein KDA60_18900 [Planctomycetales bacterium]|nr:hypothetical protein [Planctomycetales bacterium]
MPSEPIQIVRYPNRRFYDRRASRYVSLEDIEKLVRSGSDVEILDSQTREDLTRAVLTRIIMDRQPEKLQLFPTDMLHSIVRSNDMMSDFLRDYFRQSVTYLGYLQKHSKSMGPFAQPVHWLRAWLDSVAPGTGTPANVVSTGNTPGRSNDPVADDHSAVNSSAGKMSPEDSSTSAPNPSVESTHMAARLAELEARLRQLEQKEQAEDGG